MASGYLQQEIAPGGCSHAIFLHLHYHSPAPSTSQQAYQHRGSLRTQLVTARDDVLSVYDVYERPSHTSTLTIAGAGTSNGVSHASSSSSHRLVLVRRHTLFGVVTGLQRVQTLATDKDARDCLLVSFKDAKLALLEWNDLTDDLETVSIHTYERAPQLLNGTPNLFHPILNVDPLSRCAALLLPHDALAVLPFYRDAADFDFDLDDRLDLAKDDAAAVAAAAEMETLPYSPSFVLTMREVDPKIRNLKDFCFLPGFQKPTVAVLFSHTPTWTGLLAERKDTFSVYLFTLDLSASLDGTLSSAADALDDGTVRSAHPVVTTSTALPYDCLYMVSCPQTLGGVLVVCMSSVLHVDQSGRVVVTALNGWFKTISAIEPESVLDLPEIPDLQGSQLVFTAETAGVLALVDGDLYRFRCQMDGRSVEGFRLERMDQSFHGKDELVAATGPPPSCLALAAKQDASAASDYLFSASMAGDSTLYNLVPVSKALKQDGTDGEIKAEPTNDMDLDLDDDLYGPSDILGSSSAKATSAGKLQTILTVRRQDDVRSHGGLHSIARRKLTADEPGSSKRYGLVGACGSGSQAGLVYLDPRFVPEARTKVVAPTGSAEQPESLSKVFVVGRDSSGSGRMIGSHSQTDTSIAFSTSAHVSSTNYSEEPSTWTDIKQLSAGATLYAGGLVGEDVVARITANSLQVLSLDTFDLVNETIVVEAEHGSILHASLDAQQYAVVHTWDGATLVYRYDAAERRFESVDVSAALGAVSPILSANVFRDTYGHLGRARRSSGGDAATATSAGAPATVSSAAPRTLSSLPNDDEEVDYGEDDDDDEPPVDSKPLNGATAVPAETAPAYLFALDAQGMLRVWTLPDLQLVWQNASLAAQPQRLRYEQRGHAELAPEQKAVLTTAVAYHIGDTLCIVSLTSDHFLTVYRSNAWASADEADKGKTTAEAAEAEAASALTFNKVLVQVLAAPAGGARSLDADGIATTGYRAGAVKLEPFEIGTRAEKHGADGDCNALAVLGGGREAQASVLCWTEQGGYRLLDWPEGDLCCIASIYTPRANDADFAYCDRAGQLWLARAPHGLYAETSWMSSVVRTGREYTRVVAHDATHTVVAASIQPCRFVLFDEDGEPIADPGADEALPSTTAQRGALELFISEDRTTAADGYEFEANETVTALEIVTLDAPSTASGRKQFVAAGTTTFHGEDRTAKGCVYLFEVIEVVASARYQVGRDLRLKLVCRDDSRGPVTAIAQLNGFLVSTCGQKLYVRALEKEEWLISIAFLDCPLYVTGIRVVKNFVLLSDARKSLWLLAFQEEPYRFVDLGRDIHDHHATLGQYLVYNERLALVSTSGAALGGSTAFGRDAGVVRLYEYAPHVASANTRLVLRTEFQTASPATASVACRGRWLSDSELRGREHGRNKLVLAKANGALETLAAADDRVAKRLHVLQGQLVRSVLHTAALNPRAFRAVRNDFVSRALGKGVLDARLLDSFVYLSRPKMLEAVKTLSGMFEGLDVVRGDEGRKRKRKGDGDEEKEEEEEEMDFAKQEQQRLQSQHKRVQLVLKDLLRLRLGFEQV
ncbi:related to cleavage and polyadenylation specificity factor, 160 kDa subunit [Sporisorium reilianum SRZ2]|uniref:Related to cleavage and polyadenylation specificity factor, 160 kDa subunit n=1 Tax=Sporisorium reilianum (strain SRZ2) TaxID=999809 RepID=E6ZQ54_SPORE|nr:related to cleavage and polyadenylation specificity factor, 160 kDa subunit [Sporisorium reilianum SRZ2]